MPELNSLLFTELKSKFLDSIQGKCEHDQSYATVWSKVKLRGPLGGVTHKYVSLSREFKRRDFKNTFFLHCLHTEG